MQLAAGLHGGCALVDKATGGGVVTGEGSTRELSACSRAAINTH
jgi:hypothetical protein